MGHVVLIETPDLQINFTCTVDGGSGNEVSIVWSGLGVGTQPILNETDSGIFTSDLILSNATMFFSGVYQCTSRYTNILCTTNISSSLRLDVIAPPSVVSQTQSPYIVNSGINAGLFFEFLTHPSFTNVSCIGPTSTINERTPGITFSRLDDDLAFTIWLSITIFSIDFNFGGLYSCTANNSAGEIEATVLLIVRPVIQPQNVLPANGDNATLVCLVQSFPEPRYIWERSTENGDSEMNRKEVTSVLENGTIRISDSLLDFAPVRYEDFGIYRCTVTFSNASLNASSDGILLTGNYL